MSRTKDRGYLRNRRRIRDQDVCWLCGGWIDPELKSPHPMSWSADHVTPVSRGGDNRGPLKPAHRLCNQRRATAPPPPRHGRRW
jgi:hypothetical protein